MGTIERGSISVVIPMYNAERTIEGVLQSVCAQTAAEYLKEILVVDDGSTDGCAKIAAAFAARSTVPVRLIPKENGGVSSARNAGMHRAQGEWIAFCDADDTWEPDKIQKQVCVLREHEIDLLGGNHTDSVLKILTKPITQLHRGTVRELCIKMFPQTSTIIMRRSVFEQIGGFCETQHYAEDGNFFMKVAAQYRYYYMPDRLVVYDGGKQGFGESGLTANLKGMNDGLIKNLKEMRRNGYISFPFYLLMRVWNAVKYARRILIVRLRQIRR